jgi:pimeloyl-ACP methyl ester carboxylesterase
MTQKILLKTVDLPNGETLGYRESGTGSNVLILIHGNMTSSKHFDLFMEKFPIAYKVYALDLRGFGISSYKTPINAISDFSKDLKYFTEALTLKSFALAGWSLGGGVAMDFSSTYPFLVKKLITIESVSVRGFDIFSRETGKKLKTRQQIQENEAMKKLFLAFERKDREFVRLFWKKLIYTHVEPQPKKFEEYLDDVLTQQNLLDVYFALVTFDMTHEDSGVSRGSCALDNLTMPVLVIQGDRDRVNSLEIGRKNAAAIGPNAVLTVINDCGHSPFIDKMDKMIAHIIAFLQ